MKLSCIFNNKGGERITKKDISASEARICVANFNFHPYKLSFCVQKYKDDKSVVGKPKHVSKEWSHLLSKKFTFMKFWIIEETVESKYFS